MPGMGGPVPRQFGGAGEPGDLLLQVPIITHCVTRCFDPRQEEFEAHTLTLGQGSRKWL